MHKLLLSLLLFLVFFSPLAEAAYVYGSSGNGYSSPSSDRLTYYPPDRTRVTDEFFSFPRGSGSFYYTTNRDNALETFSNTRNLDRTTTFNEHSTDTFFDNQANFNRNLLDLSEDSSSLNSGNSFDGGSSTYKFGDCSTPSYQRTLQGDFKGSRNDFTLTETICGGQQVDLRRTFGNTNSYANSASFTGRNLQDFQNAGLTTRTSATDRTATLRDSQQLRNTYSLQKSQFGQGYNLVFN